MDQISSEDMADVERRIGGGHADKNIYVGGGDIMRSTTGWAQTEINLRREHAIHGGYDPYDNYAGRSFISGGDAVESIIAKSQNKVLVTALAELRSRHAHISIETLPRGDQCLSDIETLRELDIELQKIQLASYPDQPYVLSVFDESSTLPDTPVNTDDYLRMLKLEADVAGHANSIEAFQSELAQKIYTLISLS